MFTDLTVSQIIEHRERIKLSISYLKQELKNAETKLDQLQETCHHINRHSQTEYDFTAYWCDDCGKDWSTR